MTAVLGSQPAKKKSKKSRWIVHSLILLAICVILAASILPNMV